MPEITPALVGQLRAMTGAGLMACKKALDETKGDLNAAVDLLRKQGAAAAVKKADRAANEGLIGQAVVAGKHHQLRVFQFGRFTAQHQADALPKALDLTQRSQRFGFVVQPVLQTGR